MDVLDSHPAGTTFCFKAGMHYPSGEIFPGTGDKLFGEYGAVVDGSKFSGHGIRGWTCGCPGVTVKNLIVQNFTGDGIQGGAGWVVEHNELRFNSESGMKIATTTRHNFVHHNGRYGMSGGHSTKGYLVENNEISFNNARNLDWWDASGTKFIHTDGLTLRGNYVHDNNGHGLWLDGNNVSAVYEANLIENNAGAGIFHEISYAAIIRNNSLKANGKGSAYWGNRANLLVHSSPDVEIYGNSLSGLGISLISSPRDSGKLGAYELRNAHVHANTLMQTEGHTGLVQYGSMDTSAYTSWNNRFEGNDYEGEAASGSYWQWNGAKTWSQWRSYGHDSTGSAL